MTIRTPHPVFNQVIDILGQGLDQHHLARMLSSAGGPRSEASLLPISLVHRCAAQLDRALSALTGTSGSAFS
ncbi:hypothetical protein ACTWPT_50900 [Nonomuraea sp. 3N208]|uniref:hypothetical protein n=1 Tax=Nonomuraea sp. 3N208 TaxID=3457421 RepID=UPI003FD1791F